MAHARALALRQRLIPVAGKDLWFEAWSTGTLNNTGHIWFALDCGTRAECFRAQLSLLILMM
jgi:hypothetical protein